MEIQSGLLLLKNKNYYSWKNIFEKIKLFKLPPEE
jgi:hypothetical protein